MVTEICLFSLRKLDLGKQQRTIKTDGIGSINFVAAGNGILGKILAVIWDLNNIWADKMGFVVPPFLPPAHKRIGE